MTEESGRHTTPKQKVDKTLWSINLRGQEQILNQTGTK